MSGYIVEDDSHADVKGAVDDIALRRVGGCADPEVLDRGAREVLLAIVKQLLACRRWGVLLNLEEYVVDEHEIPSYMPPMY
jgi:hypothetical protein